MISSLLDHLTVQRILTGIIGSDSKGSYPLSDHYGIEVTVTVAAVQASKSGENCLHALTFGNILCLFSFVFLFIQ